MEPQKNRRDVVALTQVGIFLEYVLVQLHSCCKLASKLSILIWLGSSDLYDTLYYVFVISTHSTSIEQNQISSLY